MLGTDALALTAGNAFRGAAIPPTDQAVVEILRTEFFIVETNRIDGLKDVRNGNAHGAAVRTIATTRTANLRHVKHAVTDFADKRFLVGTEGLKITEGADVVLHLFLGAHSGKDRHHPGKGADKTQCPGGNRCIGPCGFKLFFQIGPQAGESTSLDRLHDDHWNAALVQNIVECPRANNLVIPVGIIELNLNEFDFGVCIQNLLQVCGTTVEGETEVADLAGCFLFDSPIVTIQAFIRFAVAAILHGMKQIKVKVINAAALKLFVKDAVPVGFTSHAPCGKLCGKHETLAGIAFGDGVLDDALRHSAVIDIGRVKVVHTGSHIGIHHLTYS